MKRLTRQQRCARSKAWNLAKNIYKLKENDKSTFYSPAEEWVLPAASTKEPEVLSSLVDSAELVHEDIKESDDGDDGQRRGANKRRSDGKCQTIGPLRQSSAS